MTLQLKAWAKIIFQNQQGVNEDDFTVEGMGKNNFSEPVQHKSVKFNEEKIDKSFSSPSSSKSFPSTFKSTEESEGAQEPKSKFKQINNISDQRERARSPRKSDKTGNLRSRSLSTLKNVGQKVKTLTNEKLKIFSRTKSQKGEKDI